MMIGEYPCCNDVLNIDIPDNIQLPAYFNEECPHCGEKVWHQLSRATPCSWTEKDFMETHTVDHDTMVIKDKG